MIRLANSGDFKEIKRIANQNREFIGFVMNVALEESVKNKSLLVIENYSEVVGFVHYHPRKDGWNTIHEIAIDKNYHGMGFGQQLFDEVPLPIRLKTTKDNVNAISFYEKNGMKMVRVEQGKKRELLVFEKNI